MRRVRVISARAQIHSYSTDRDRCSRGILKIMASCPSTDRGKKAKRKRVVLSILDTLEILKMLDKSVSYSIICEKYGTGRSTVGDIKINRDKLTDFQRVIECMGLYSSVCVYVMNYNFRSYHDNCLYQPYSRTCSFYNSFVTHTTLLRNNLPQHIVSSSTLYSFKQSLSSSF